MRIVLTLSFVLVLSLASIAAAQAPDTREAARAAFAAGRAAFAEDDVELALRQFQLAFELLPNDAVRFNIAVCLERLGRFREAALEYDQAAHSTTLDAATRTEAAELAARDRTRLGTLIVEGPPGAEVRVDGAVLCTLPCRVELDPADHVVAIEQDGRTAEARTTVERGTTAHVSLALGEAGHVDAPEPVTPAHAPRDVTALTWVGVGLAVVGLAATVGFGVHAEALHDGYLAMPDASVRDQGLLARDLTNVGIVVLGVGALLVAIDLVWWAVDSNEADSARAMLRDGLRF